MMKRIQFFMRGSGEVKEVEGTLLWLVLGLDHL